MCIMCSCIYRRGRPGTGTGSSCMLWRRKWGICRNVYHCLFFKVKW
nr:MAG TPA: hypothetical protein [Caudoviricetes sp.]